MTQDYIELADKMLRDSGCYPRERALVVAALARSLAIHDAELLEAEAMALASLYDAWSPANPSHILRSRAATVRENVGEGKQG